MRLFRFLLRGSWPTIAISVVVGVIGGAAGLGLIHLIRHAMRGGATPDPSTLYYFIGLSVTVLVTRAISQLIMSRYSKRTVSRLVRHLYQQLPQVPLRKLEEIGAKLHKIMTKDVKIIGSAMDVIPELCIKTAIALCALGYLAWLSPKLFGSIALFGIVGGTIYYLISRRARRSIRRARELQNTLHQQVRQMIEGVKELKLHKSRQEAFLEGGIGAADAILRKRQMASRKILALASTVGRFLGLLALALLLFVWPHVEPINMSTLFIFGFIMILMMRQSGSVGTGFNLLFGRARAAAKRLEKLGISARDIEKQEAAVPAEPLDQNWQRLELTGVTYQYKPGDEPDADDDLDDDAAALEYFGEGASEWTAPSSAAPRGKEERTFVLGPIDFTVRPGEVTFVVGGNGGGKTTLLKVLTGLYSPDSGEIRVDGQKIDVHKREAYRQLFTCMFDDTVLFESLYGIDLNQVEERARKYLEALHLDREVKIVDGKFSIAGTLSKGQRKRLALVSAHLEDRSIYVFDEWAANQDPLFKRVFYKTILPDLKARNRTVIAVTHDDNYFDCADRILVLRDGKAIDGDWQDNLFHPNRQAAMVVPVSAGESSSSTPALSQKVEHMETAAKTDETKESKFPRFLCIGAPRAGTTWLHQNLLRHPQIWLPPVKELHYFDFQRPGSRSYYPVPNATVLLMRLYWRIRHFWIFIRKPWRRLFWHLRYTFGFRTDRWYSKLFRKDRVSGEITPSYMLMPKHVIEDIHRINPEMKIILLLRNPVSRAWSNACYRLGKKTATATDEMLLKRLDWVGTLMRGDYVNTIKNWRAVFGEKQIFIGFYDDLVSAPRDLLRSILQFLGVDASDERLPTNTEKVVNASVKREIPPHLVPHLYKMYIDQLRELEQMVGGPVSKWLKKAEEAIANKTVENAPGELHTPAAASS